MRDMNNVEISNVAGGDWDSIVAGATALIGGIVGGTAGGIAAAGAGGYLLGSEIYETYETEIGAFVDGVARGYNSGTGG